MIGSESVAELLDAQLGVGLLGGGHGGQRGVDVRLRLLQVTGHLEVHERRAPVLGDLSLVALRERGLDVGHVLGSAELCRDVVDGGPELRVGGLLAVAGLHENRLGGLLRERIGAGLVGDARGAVALLLGSKGLGADHAADHERDGDEREPPEDGGFAVLRRPAPGAGREIGVGHFACLPVLGSHASKRVASAGRRH